VNLPVITASSHRMKIGAAMNIRAFVFICALLFATPLLAEEKTDVLVMKNGDHLTCEIKQLNAGVLYISLDYATGTIPVDWKEVVRVESKHLFHVQTEDGSRYTGTLSTAATSGGRPVKIEVVEAPAKTVEIERSNVVAIGQTSQSFWKRFNGAINTGITYAKGNQSTQLTLGSEVDYPRERWDAHATFDSTLSASSGTKNSARNELMLAGLRYVRRNNWYYAGIGDFLQSSVQGIQMQTSLGGGIGHYFKNTNRVKFSVLGGAAWQSTNYEPTLVSQEGQNIATALVASNLKFFVFDKTDLSIAAMLFPAISDPGRVRFGTRATYFVKLFGDISWNISFYGNWDNKPIAGFSGSDYGTTSGISWTFGSR
jgi:putative salt-induced outer membrane protein YdiY